jgi:hypothetical protein
MRGRTWVRRALLFVVLSAMTVSFGGWQIVGCADQPPAPIAAVDSTSGGTHAKRGLTTRMVWVWGDSIVCPGGCFDVADQRSFISWGYNVNNRSIPWIDKSGRARCLAPVGTCSVEYEDWRTEVCDRDGPDTCLFRREAAHRVSFTYGVAFNRYLTSCVGTRINWDGSHVRNAWGGDCLGAQAIATSAGLTIGTGDDEVRIDRYLSRTQIERFDRACLSRGASRAECKQTALGLLRSLPPKACAALSPDALRRLHPGTRCARKAAWK